MTDIFKSGHALLIGVGADLPTTINDAQGLAAMLTDAERCAYPPEQVQCLTGPAATRAAVLTALDTLAQRANAESTVVVYFSGHGYTVATALDDLYFLMPYGYDVNQLKTTAIRGTEFAAKLRAIPAQKLLVLLDCCHAGGVGEAKAPGIETLSKSPLPPEALALLQEGRGRVLIASSREDELSYAGKPYSAFTLALIEALAGVGVAKKDGFVRVADLALHTRQVVPGRTKNRQHPVLHFEHADNFVLAYYAGGDTQPKGLPFAAEAVEIEPEPGAWQGQVSGSGALAQGDHATALGAGAVQVGGSVGGDVVTGNKSTTFDQRGQIVGAQTNIAGNVTGPVLSGQFDGPVAMGGGEAVDLRGSQGAVYKPSGSVKQHFGDQNTVTGNNNVVGNNNYVRTGAPQAGTLTVDEFLRLLAELRQAIPQAGLDPDEAEAIIADLQAAEMQARKPQPNARLILSRITNVAGLLATADGVAGMLLRLQPLAQQLQTWAGQLFR